MLMHAQPSVASGAISHHFPIPPAAGPVAVAAGPNMATANSAAFLLSGSPSAKLQTKGGVTHVPLTSLPLKNTGPTPPSTAAMDPATHRYSDVLYFPPRNRRDPPRSTRDTFDGSDCTTPSFCSHVSGVARNPPGRDAEQMLSPSAMVRESLGDAHGQYTNQ